MFYNNKNNSYFQTNTNLTYIYCIFKQYWYYQYHYSHRPKKSEVTSLDWFLSDATPSYLGWCGKGNQWFSSNSMTELLGAPTHHLTFWFSHTIVPTSPSLNGCQPTERGCDVHQWLLAHFRPSLKAHSNELLVMTTVHMKVLDYFFMFKRYFLYIFDQKVCLQLKNHKVYHLNKIVGLYSTCPKELTNWDIHIPGCHTSPKQ